MDLISHLHWLTISKQQNPPKSDRDLEKKTSAQKLTFGQNLDRALLNTGDGNPFTNSINSTIFMTRFRKILDTEHVEKQSTSEFITLPFHFPPPE